MKSEAVVQDTNIYINHYLGYEPVVNLFEEIIDRGEEIHMSAVVVMELMSYHEIENNSEIKAARQGYINAADEIIDVTKDIALKAAEIRRTWYIETGKKLKYGDALIAATALVNDAILYSNNDKDFRFIKETYNLRYINRI